MLFFSHEMFILYVDESGDPGAAGTKHQVVLGVGLHELQIQSITRRIEAVVKRHLPQRLHQANLHATDIRTGKRDFRGISKANRQKILEEVFGIIDEPASKGIALFASVVSKANLKSGENSYAIAIEDVYNRFDWFLKRAKADYGEQRGIVVVESTKLRGTVAPLLDGWRKGGTSWAASIERIVETPFFLDKGSTRLLDLADFFSWAVFRNYEFLDNSFFKMLEPHFRLGTQSILVGLRHQRASIGCGCPPCRERTTPQTYRAKRRSHSRPHRKP